MTNIEKRFLELEKRVDKLEESTMRKDTPMQSTLFKIIMLVAYHYNLTEQEMMGRRHLERITWPRFVAMFICRELTTVGTADIAVRFERHDHSTVLHGLKRVKDRMDTEPKTKTEVLDLKESIALKCSGCK